MLLYLGRCTLTPPVSIETYCIKALELLVQLTCGFHSCIVCLDD